MRKWRPIRPFTLQIWVVFVQPVQYIHNFHPNCTQTAPGEATRFCTQPFYRGSNPREGTNFKETAHGGFYLGSSLILGKSEYFDYDVDPEVRKIGVEWFESLF